MKKIKLSQDQIRRWRANRFALLDNDTGEFVRYANTEESKAATQAQSRKRNIRVKDGNRLLNFRPDRERMKEELIALHGESVRAYDRSMRPLFYAKIFTPTVSPHEKPTAPNPTRCQCAEWEGRPDGKHHPFCKFNKIAPEEHRSDLGDLELESSENKKELDTAKNVKQPPDKTQVIRNLLQEAGLDLDHVSDQDLVPALKVSFEKAGIELESYHPENTKAAPVALIVPTPDGGQAVCQTQIEESEEVPTSSTIEVSETPPAPGDCPEKCFKWRRPNDFDPEQHHPSCPCYEAWRSHSSGNLPYFIYTLNGTLMRPATPEEIKESKHLLETAGSPTVIIGKEEFLCLNEEP